MSRLIVADTGPLVALFHGADLAHPWAVARFQEFTEPLVTCEAVLTEALHLLRKVPPAHFSLLALWERQILRIRFSAERERDASPEIAATFWQRPDVICRCLPGSDVGNPFGLWISGKGVSQQI